DTIMVRHTREMVALWGSRTRLTFPQSGDIEVLEYDLPDACPGLAECAGEVIPALAFPAHSVPDPAVRELLRLGLLKRLESGSWAFGASIRRHILLLGWFIEAARAGLQFDACVHRGHAPPGDGAVQLMLDPLVLPPWPPSRDREGSIEAAKRDLHGLVQMKARLLEGTDPKLDRLRTLLDDELKDETVLLFTEYRDTAHGIWHALARRAGVGMIHGSDARLGLERASRRAIIHRFAPRSNGVSIPRDAERVRVLIATDVLAEGLDLQDARVLISWDLPWNPVRLAQRIGRIDRLGSPHARIRTIAFRPDPRIDALLGLTRRIRRKLRQIRCVGGDAPAWRDMRRSRRISRELDEAARARESLRVRYLVARRPSGGEEVSGAGAATIAALHWGGPNEAALCCFRTHTGEVLLVLTAPGAPAEVNTAAAWSALAAADRSPAAAAPDAAHARQAEHAARRALSAGWSRDRTGAPARAAATYVGAWLASRPGGPTDDEVDVADRLLRRLATGARAGTELRLKRLLAPAYPAEDAGGRLEECLTEAGNAPAYPRRPAATEAELIGTIVLRPDRWDANVNAPNRPC
ncbi:MAG TPA: helicase-related protein, partial [Longimicrobiales bacterium]